MVVWLRGCSFFAFLWYANLRLSRFFAESLPAAIHREERRTKVLCESFPTASALDCETVQQRRLARLRNAKTCLGRHVTIGWLVGLVCLRELEQVFEWVFNEATISQGCVLHESLCVDLPSALPSSQDLFYWLLSPLPTTPSTLTGNGLVVAGGLAVAEVGLVEISRRLLVWEIRRNLYFGELSKVNGLFFVYDVLYSEIWPYVLSVVYLLSFSTWRTVTDDNLAVYAARSCGYWIIFLFGVAIFFRPKRRSSFVQSKQMRLALLETRIVSAYRDNPNALARLSNHALLEIATRLLKDSQSVCPETRRRIKMLITTRAELRGIIAFSQLP